MSDPLSRAINNLAIRDVFFQRFKAELEDDFDPRFDDTDGLATQLKVLIKSTSVLELRDSETDEVSERLFQVRMDLGIRWVRVGSEVTSKAANKLKDESAKQTTVATINATMLAEYEMRIRLGELPRNEFAAKNAIYHVWPYWREFVSTECARLNLPRVVLPFRVVPSNKDVKPERVRKTGDSNEGRKKLASG